MEELEFELKKDQEYIQLNQLMQVTGFAQTGGHAKLLIQEENVNVNNEPERQVRKKLRAGDVVHFQNSKIHIINHQ